ncbi:glycopolyprotein precursor [Jonchet virus]|uniref:Glycopolyprotein n=1 Tax=Jonchet virus TaxID=1664809 RepID=A0A0H4B8P9_9VIRU|nr:glycopolyprotein precursor [Jonchet virus]AKN56872.1 glycopolyprotein precursor [Jonchet virus]
MKNMAIVKATLAVLVSAAIVVGLTFTIYGGIKDTKIAELGIYVIYLSLSIGLGMKALQIFYFKTPDNKNLMEDMCRESEDLSKDDGLPTDTIDMLDDVKVIRSQNSLTMVKRSAAGLALLDMGNRVQAMIIEGNRNCCKVISTLSNTKLCKITTSGLGECFNTKPGDTTRMDDEGMVTVGGKFFCARDDECKVVEVAAMDYMATLLKFIIITFLIGVSVRLTVKMYGIIVSKKKVIRKDEETGDVVEVEAFNYLSIWKALVIITLWVGSATLLYGLGRMTSIKMNTEAFSINPKDKVTIHGLTEYQASQFNAEEYINSRNWDCKLNIEKYALEGITETKCVEALYNSRKRRDTGASGQGEELSNVTTLRTGGELEEDVVSEGGRVYKVIDGVTYVKTIVSNTTTGLNYGGHKYGVNLNNVDPRCLSQRVIEDKVINGISRCYKKCEHVAGVEVCTIEYSNINVRAKRASVPPTTAYEFAMGEARVEVDKPLGNSYTVQLFSGFYTGWSDHDITDPLFEGGIIKSFEADGSEKGTSKDCGYSGSSPKMGFICTHKRREMITCHKGYYGKGREGATEFECIRYDEPTANANMPTFLNPYINTDHIIRTGGLAKIEHDMPLDSSFRIDNQNYDIKGKISYFESSQDSDQVSGQDKYFIYSAIVVAQISAPDAGSLQYFAHYYAKLMQNNAAGPATDLFKLQPYTLFRARQEDIEAPDFSLEFLYRPKKSSVNCKSGWQDRVQYSFVYKTDVMNSRGQSYNEMCAVSTQACSSTFSRLTGQTTMDVVIPVYYAIRMYGPAKANVKIFNKIVDTITLTNGMTDCLDCLKVRGEWYKPDFSSVSTDVTVTGYPLTHMTGLFSPRSTEGCQAVEIFWFYLAHPKMGAALYLAKVSATADIGKYSTKGKCVQLSHDKDGALKCDGSHALTIPIVKYTTFYTKESKVSKCHMQDNHLVCKSQGTTEYHECTRHIDSMEPFKCSKKQVGNMTQEIKPNTQNFVRYNNEVIVVSRGSHIDEDKLFSGLIDIGHRCVWCLIIVLASAGYGFVVALLLVTAIILGYINAYNIKGFFRWVNLLGPLPKCDNCGFKVETEEEMQRHNSFCAWNICPYCARRVEKKDGPKRIYRRKYGSSKALKAHIERAHMAQKRNKVLAFFKIRRMSIIAFIYVEWLTLNRVNAQTINHRTGLRSNNTGHVYNVDERLFECSDKWCEMSGSVTMDLPITPGVKFVLQTIKSGQTYSRNMEVTQASIRSSCTYDYSSMSFEEGIHKTTVKCTDTVNCNKFGRKDLFTPLGTGKEDKYVPFDTSNPLKEYYCPTSFTCRSPAVGFTWLAAGCVSINTGIAIGYKTLLPLPTEDIISVFTCKISSIDYKMCDGSECSEVTSESEKITNGSIRFPIIPTPLFSTFRVGAVAKQGETKPRMLLMDPPSGSQVSRFGYYQFKAYSIPQASTCLEGMVAAPVPCSIVDEGLHPATECPRQGYVINFHELLKDEKPLTDAINCNMEETTLKWDTKVIERKVVVNGKSYEDSQTIATPSMTLSLKSCNFGSRQVFLDNNDKIRLRAHDFKGTVNSVKCSGNYNRNHKVMLDFDLDIVSPGMMHVRCGDGSSDACYVNTETTNKCNLTMILPGKYTCVYNDKSFTADCTNLTMSQPDLASGTIISGTGSGQLDSWVSGFSLTLSTPWGIAALTVGSCLTVFFIILFSWLWYSRRTMDTSIKSMRTRPFMRNSAYEAIESSKYKQKVY